MLTRTRAIDRLRARRARPDQDRAVEPTTVAPLATRDRSPEQVAISSEDARLVRAALDGTSRRAAFARRSGVLRRPDAFGDCRADRSTARHGQDPTPYGDDDAAWSAHMRKATVKRPRQRLLTGMMHDEFADAVAAYASTRSMPAERPAFEAHLPSCARAKRSSRSSGVSWPARIDDRAGGAARRRSRPARLPARPARHRRRCDSRPPVPTETPPFPSAVPRRGLRLPWLLAAAAGRRCLAARIYAWSLRSRSACSADGQCVTSAQRDVCATS